jgi:hypothetical protein
MVLSYLVCTRRVPPSAEGGTRHHACILSFANTVLYSNTLVANEGSEGLLHLKPMEEDRTRGSRDARLPPRQRGLAITRDEVLD